MDEERGRQRDRYRVTHGRTFGVDQPQVIPMAEATKYFGPKEQKLHRRFAVESCLQVHRTSN